MQQFFDKIKDLDLVSEISKHVSLKRAGANYKANCPFPHHKESTPSFMVSPGKGMYKCFGCGTGGNNAASFLMDIKGYTWWDACVELAKANQIDIPNVKERTPEEDLEYQKNEAVKTVLKAAMGFYEEQLQKNPEALSYVNSRWSDETVKLFNIGYAPDGNLFYRWAREKGYKTDLLLDADLIKISKNESGGYYDTFRNRIMFPMCDKYGRPVGFSGRILPTKQNTGEYNDNKDIPKYVNSKESDIFQKGRMFYGFHLAQRVMRDKKMAYLVEGHPDVIRMHEILQSNTVATSGTALTIDQVKILKSIVDSVNIIGDTDDAGQKAIRRSAEMLISEGIFVNVVILPEEEGKKYDPDSFFTTSKSFDDFVTGSNIKDYIYMKADQWKKKANNPDFKKRAMDEICELVSNLPATVHGMYVEQLSKIIPSRKVWDQSLRAVMKEKEPEVREQRIPDHVKLSDFEKYGFYEDHNCYYFQGRGGSASRGSNFVMKPLFHIVSVSNAKRLYEITNEYGYSTVIELLQKDLVALSRFRERVEGVGNFLWEAQEGELNRLKRYLYEKTDSCLEVTQLGWQKSGFWAWGNGIYNGQFKKTDSHGIVAHDEKNYYLPAFSRVYEGEEGLFTAERRFVHTDYPGISLFGFSTKLIDVFGDNAKFGICFYLATLFRDYIVRKFNFYPILNLFGPKGAGKTELAVSLMQFFGKQPKGPNINNTSKAALADHVAMTCNALCHIDEYKNNLEFEKIEFLKGLWDGTGRTRMNMDKDKKKETTAVDSGIIISGQEMPTADIALFSRLIYLTFYQTTFSDEEKAKYNDLKEVEKNGLTNITHDILQHRDYFINHFMDNYDKAAADLQTELKEVIEDRIFKNWLIPIAAYRTLADRIKVPFTYKDLIKEASVQLSIQNRETRKSNEITSFWNIIQFLYENHDIQEAVDFKIDFAQTTLKTDIIDAVWSEPKNVIYIQYGRIMPLYLKTGKQAGEKILPRESMDYYLRNDKARYLGKKRVRFQVSDKLGTILQDEAGNKKYKITNAYAFLYDELDISMHSSADNSVSPPAPPSQREIDYGANGEKLKEDLPF